MKSKKFRSIFIIFHIIALSNLLLKTVTYQWIKFAIISFLLRMFFIGGFYHRYFAHHSYQTSRWIQFCFAVLGCTALQGGPLRWSSNHRYYHHHHFVRPFNIDESIKSEFITDWLSYTELVWLEKFHFLPYLTVSIFVFVLNGYDCFVWTMIIPQIPLWYLTYAIHSLVLVWGTRRFVLHDNSKRAPKNNGWIALLTLGEGWCNNHYADIKSAQHGLFSYECDLTFRILQCLNRLCIIWSMESSQLYKNENEDDIHRNLSSSHDIGMSIKYPYNAIYEGTVAHTRFRPIINQFSYKLYMMYIELDESTTESAFDNFWFWSSIDEHIRTLPALASFRASDYLSKEKIQVMIREEWENHLISQYKLNETDTSKKNVLMNPLSISRICLLTHFRYYGIKFNPVSYYYCFDGQNNIVAMISEVHNTPWSETCWYVHLIRKVEENPELQCPSFVFKSSTDDIPGPDYYFAGDKMKYTDCKIKKMRVSPFFTMNYTYRVKFDLPDDSLNVSWEMFSHRMSNEETRDFYVSMRLRKIDISQLTLNRILLKYPAMTIKVILGIYYEAALLYLRKVPFITHPSKQNQNFVKDEIGKKTE